MNAHQLTVIDTHSNVEAYRASTNAADLCKEIVVATSSNIQGRKFVSVEGWQAIAVAHGCVLSARDVEKVDGGVRAIGEVRRMSDGQIIATGEGFVGEDEPTWYGGVSRGKTLPKRNDYAIRAMAQTRAMSRAGRTAFAHVVVMMKAGLATTPAEEVPQEGFDTPHNPQTGEIIEHEPVKGITKIKERLRAFMAAASGDDVTLEQFRQLKRENREDLKTIRDANHSWWTGDGEDFEGYEKWMARRQAELEEAAQSDGMVSGLIESLNRCETKIQLQNWLTGNGDVVEALDGADSRKFQLAYDLKTSLIEEQDRVSA